MHHARLCVFVWHVFDKTKYHVLNALMVRGTNSAVGRERPLYHLSVLLCRSSAVAQALHAYAAPPGWYGCGFVKRTRRIDFLYSFVLYTTNIQETRARAKIRGKESHLLGNLSTFRCSPTHFQDFECQKNYHLRPTEQVLV